VLNEINESFVNIYMTKDGPNGCLFLSDSSDNYNTFQKYCNEVSCCKEKAVYVC
jgi:hypothetical protein